MIGNFVFWLRYEPRPLAAEYCDVLYVSLRRKDGGNAYELFQEWVVYHAHDGDALHSEPNGGSDHREAMDLLLSTSWPSQMQTRTKFVVPSIGLKHGQYK